MRAYIGIWFIVILFLSGTVQSGAQDSLQNPLPSTWTLQQCLDFAKQHNIQINTLRLTKQSNEQDLLQSKAATYPNLSGSSSQSLTNSKNANPVVGGFQTQSSFASNYSLNSSMILYNGGFLKNDIKQKDALVQSAQFNVEAAENDITLQIIQGYLNILLAKENTIYLQDLVQTSQAQLEQGQIKFNSGAIAKKDLVALEAQVADDKYNLVTAQNLQRQNTLTLKQLLQLPSGYIMNIVQPDTVVAESPVTSLDEVQKNALGQRPEVKSSQLEVEAAQLQLIKARAGSKPTVSANGALSSGYSNNQKLSYMSQLDNNFYQRLGLSIGIPIFNNRTVKTNIEKSKIAVDQANLNLKNTETILSQQVEQAYINVLNAQSQYEASMSKLNANQENYRIATEQLRLGAINSTDYLLQKNLYVQALQSYIQAKYNSAMAVKVYEYYNGNPNKQLK